MNSEQPAGNGTDNAGNITSPVCCAAAIGVLVAQ